MSLFLMCVYDIRCGEDICTYHYIGDSGGTLGERFKEHKKKLANLPFTDMQIAQVTQYQTLKMIE